MTTFVRLALVASLVACGGKSKPAEHDHHDHEHADAGSGSATAQHDHHDMAGSGSGSADVKPTEPTKPEGPDPAKVKADLLAAEMDAYEKAKPVFEKSCARCHKQGGSASTEKKRGHFDMTKYPFGGHHAATIAAEIRKSLAIGGGKPTMPYDKKGSVKGDDLALIATWADTFDKAAAGGAHEGAAHDHDHEH
jgi:hypothetical protein